MQQSVTIEETYRAMSEIAYGDKCPSVKLAFWNSALSSRMKLDLNGRYARIMASYVNKPLPLNREVLIDELGRKQGNKLPQGMMFSHIELLYRIEKLYNEGKLDFNCGTTLESQQVWRKRMVELIPGMGSKLVSWALFIYSPFDCLLLTIDCWHCKRIGVEQSTVCGTTASKQAKYLETEKSMLSECQALYPQYPPVVVAAMLWENIRRANNASQGTNGYQSHKEISCRWY